MIAVDTSSMVAFLQGTKGEDVKLVKQFIESESIILPPLVLSELLSDSQLPQEIYDVIVNLPVLKIKEGCWQRVGKLRAKILKKKLKARMADSLIAQSCLDYDSPLITRDRDFRHFSKYTELILLN